MQKFDKHALVLALAGRGSVGASLLSGGPLTRILILGDNSKGVDFLRSALTPHGYDLMATKTIAAGLAEARRNQADLIILDIAQPSFDGYRVLRQLREADADTQVLMVNAGNKEDDKVRALRLGADHYLTKPIGINELLARVEAMLRRLARPSPPRRESREPVIRCFGTVEINVSSQQVWRDKKPVPLRPREMDLLLGLLEREGHVVSREELLQRVWGYEREVSTRTVDNHIAKLRRQLEDNPAQPKHIISVRKKGYRFQS